MEGKQFLLFRGQDIGVNSQEYISRVRVSLKTGIQEFLCVPEGKCHGGE